MYKVIKAELDGGSVCFSLLNSSDINVLSWPPVSHKDSWGSSSTRGTRDLMSHCSGGLCTVVRNWGISTLDATCCIYSLIRVCSDVCWRRQVISLEFQTCSTHDHGCADCFVGYLILEFGFAATVSMENNWGRGGVGVAGRHLVQDFKYILFYMLHIQYNNVKSLLFCC